MSMKFNVVIIIMLSGCMSKHEITSIEGLWKSNKEMTIRHFSDNGKLVKIRTFLERNLGDLQFSFKGNQAKIFFNDIPENEVEAQTFSVIESNKDRITIVISLSAYQEHIVTYYWSNGCFYLVQKEYGYNEYFCRLIPNE